MKRSNKLASMSQAIAEHVPDGASVLLGAQLEQMIPFAAGHEIIRQRKRDMTLIGPRAETPNFIPYFTQEQREILNVKPGCNTTEGLL